MLSAGRIISKKPRQFQLHRAVFVRYVLPSSWEEPLNVAASGKSLQTLQKRVSESEHDFTSDTGITPYHCRRKLRPPTTSRWEWSSKPTTRATPPQSASPRWWAWRGSDCASVWMGATTATTSGGWWTRRTSSPSARVRRTGTCCSLHWVRETEEKEEGAEALVYFSLHSTSCGSSWQRIRSHSIIYLHLLTEYFSFRILALDLFLFN